VLGYTANAQPEEKQRCQDAGMDDCLFKPISLTALNDRLSKVMPLRAASAQGAVVAVVAVANGTAKPRQEVFDPLTIEALTGGRADMNARLLDQLIDSIRQDRVELNASTLPEQLKDIGHKVRGAANIISATAVIEACEALEAVCEAEAPDATVGERQSALDAALGVLEKALVAYRGKTPAPKARPLA
jgi:two-component system sensor histidine kinase EvgS